MQEKYGVVLPNNGSCGWKSGGCWSKTLRLMRQEKRGVKMGRVSRDYRRATGQPGQGLTGDSRSKDGSVSLWESASTNGPALRRICAWS